MCSIWGVSSQTRRGLVRDKVVPRDLVFFRLATAARVPSKYLRHPFRASPTNRVGQRMTPVPLRQIYTRLEFLLLISSISCLSRLALHFHHGLIPSRSSVTVWTLQKVFWTDLPPPLKPFAKHSQRLLRLSVPCFRPTLVHLWFRRYFRLWVPQELR